MFMTPRNRYNLIRFGNIIFLDAQKRQMNEFCWPYIGPVIKNGENKVGTVCESIVTGETLSFYVWILKMMEETEPTWKLSNIKIIFADNFIAEELLSSLGIEDTCTLRCDKYHLLHEVWPSGSSFGEMYLASIKVYLLAMLDSRTKDQ